MATLGDSVENIRTYPAFTQYNLTFGGAIFTWGWGGSHGTFSVDGHSSGGQLGHGSDVDYVKPTKIDLGENVKVVQVSCGFNHTGAILEYK
uniref:Uncharacterized protein n=1 Tax=Cucumis sativus TaxID=3659 RepID=A0A0A0L2M2_CUCSA